MIVTPNPKAAKSRKPMSPLKADLTTALKSLDREDYIYQIELIKAHSWNYQGNPQIKKRVILFCKDRACVQSMLHPLVEKYSNSVQFVFKNWFKGCDTFKGKQTSDYRPKGRSW
jgi:hypothetical protein